VTETLRVGIVGVGWGALVQAPAFAAVPQFDAVALCGRTPERLQKASERTGITDLSQDWRAFVRRDDLDLISVATPVDLHHPVALAAIDAGKHVLIEKPMALTAALAGDIVDAAAAAGVQGATCFELRWTPDRLAIWDLVAAGALGDPYFVRSSQVSGVWHPTAKLQSPWMYRVDEGGGYLNAQLAHDIDFVRALFGDPVAVCADVRTSVPTRTLPDGGVLDVDADDTDALVLRLSSGALAVVTCSVVGVHAAGAQFEAFGRNGTIIARSGGTSSSAAGRGDEVLLFGSAGEEGLRPLAPSDREPVSRPELPAGRFSSAAIRSFALMLEDWLPAFDGERSRAATLADGWAVQRIIEAARRSSDGAGWVELDGVAHG
jgi:predicted dehydrogenase